MAKNQYKPWAPGPVEAYWRNHWQTNRTFTPDPNSPGEPFSIVIPPPNVTGALHIGHALNLSLIDVLCRHARQLGKNVLWIPGTDHAGISTQNVVERSLAKEGKGRNDLGRDAFIERVWQWREDFGGRILEQIAAIGCSVDWTRLRFTMDEGLSRAVRKVFVTLYEQGLIYQGEYIINWCPRCHTALADDEVEHVNEPGCLWKIQYRLAGGTGTVTVATTRPETIPGDTAICVHPEDSRYTELVGKFVHVPVSGRKIPIISDSYVDREFGTGCLKVTPCHDPNDWLLGKRHRLEFVQVIDENNVMKAEAGKYAGLTTKECRAAILDDLRQSGQLVAEDKVEHAVGRCYRCNTVVEPYVSRQWFVAATRLAPAARKTVPELTRLMPENWLKTYYHWLDNIRDWCISRQIWWGHRIPAWTCQSCGKLIVVEEDPSQCPHCGCSELVQDEDVLDTWFSSALWPFSTLGWPDITPELRKWYPTSTLVTGFDILFFWVARMMMMGIHFLGEPPFKDIYLHALVRDAQGQKMSKSKGNGIDPLEMIEKYGCDALRFTLVSMAAMGRDIRLSEERIDTSRHFVNKLWNASRFVLMNLQGTTPTAVDLTSLSELSQIWILDRLESAKLDMLGALAGYRFNDAAMAGYHFLWNDYCDWFVEWAKSDLLADEQSQRDAAKFVLWLVLRETLLLLYPIMPFVTAEIWHALPQGTEPDDIALVPYPAPRPECSRPEDITKMEFLQNVIIAARTIKAELGISPNRNVTMFVHPANAEQEQLLLTHRKYIRSLARLVQLGVHSQCDIPKASATQVVDGAVVSIPLSEVADLAGELARLDKELGKLDKEIVEVNKKLHNESFVNRAPQEIVARERERAEKLLDARHKLEQRREKFALAEQIEAESR